MWNVRAHQARTLLALLAAAALLFAAGAGLGHRITHGLAKVPDTAPAPSTAALHSCAALDAAALGAALAARPVLTVPWRQRPPTPGHASPASAELQRAVHFCARAPPPGPDRDARPVAAGPAWNTPDIFVRSPRATGPGQLRQYA